MTRVAVFGATGYAGGHITAELLARGHEVVAVARDVSGVEPRPGLVAEAGSLYDEGFLARIAAGVDVLVIAVHGNSDPPLVTQLPMILRVAAANRVRVGVVGGASSLQVRPGGPRLLDDNFPEQFRAEATAHARALDALRAADTPVDWFYLSPSADFGSYNPGERTGVFRLGDDVLLTDENGVSTISGADYAIAFVDEIERPAHHQTRFTVGY